MVVLSKIVLESSREGSFMFHHKRTLRNNRSLLLLLYNQMPENLVYGQLAKLIKNYKQFILK